MKPSKRTTLDVLTTSVGRLLVQQTYESFFRHAQFDGKYNFIVTVDRTYGVSDEEYQETLRYFRALRDVDRRVRKVTVETWEGNIGLQRSLIVLFSHCRNPFGINLEDDWCFFADIDLDALLLDLVDQKSTMIAFSNTGVAADGTFTRVGEVEDVPHTRVPLVRLISPSWACDYLPLCPHLHDADRWLPAYTKALMLNDDPYRCPDERVKAFVRGTASRTFYNVLWTKAVVVKDIGRDWLFERNQTRNIGPTATVPVRPISA
jgi:hypothetical protein